MSKNKLFLKEALELENNEKPYAIATVINVKGSSSGKVGDKAIFDEKGYRIIGYVGGGCIENRASDVAIETLINGIPKIIEIDLDSETIGMGIPCGGSMSVLVEPQMNDPVILIRGEGSIVESLCTIAKMLNFKVIIHTSKSHIHTSKSNEELYPNADKIITEGLGVEDIDDNINYFILATHHSNDDKIALEAIRKGISYVGVIASQKKADLIKEYLSDNNVSGPELKNLYSPIGLDLKATTPEEIALSILSEIVMLENEATGKQMKHLGLK
ncbi:MAG: XdhC family protein [Candidatus Marinimicrobia bacterium]|jgi:xanthine dehydrogenase accessory factor|nr:XdhC family protein [Candidatus Neomarinimicrobiota bacterium]|tara:strand:+ start:478 stop:1293 length:816 start_codon:yes stop_codon:yes gene_type:complete